jgi:hypothetical protein
VLPIFILKLAHRDNDENNNCHRQEDINPHIASNNGIARKLTLGANQHCLLCNVAASLPFTPMTAWRSVGFQEISVAGDFSARQVVMAAVDGPVHVESPIPIGGIQAAVAGIDVSISGTEARQVWA